MISFHEVLFPEDTSYGSTGGPGTSTNVIENDAGQVFTVSRWNGTRRRYNAAYTVRSPQSLAEVQTFYICRGGPANGFRFKNWYDFHSNPTDPTYTSGPGTEDQSIGTGDGTTTSFQLKKLYISGLITKTRVIRKPVGGTVRVWVAGVEKTEGVDFTVDTTTGIVLFTTAPTLGQSVKASFEFHDMVMFAKELDSLLNATIENYGHGSIAEIPLVEIMDANPGYVDEFPYGGSNEISVAANYTLSTGLGRYHVINMTASGKSVLLPSPANIPHGGPVFYVENAGSNSFALKNHLGSTLTTLSAGQMVEVLLSKQASGTKVWCVA